VPKKQATYEQVQAKKDKAVQFLRDVVGDDDKADDFEDMDVQAYADKKHIQIVNTGRSGIMTIWNGRAKQDLLDEIDELTQEN
jgi:phenylalanine-4-hydroxylase